MARHDGDIEHCRELGSLDCRQEAKLTNRWFTRLNSRRRSNERPLGRWLGYREKPNSPRKCKVCPVK